MRMLKRSVKYIAVFVIGLMLMAWVLWLKDFSLSLSRASIYRILCDAAFFAAVILVGIGLMVSISNFGLFTAVSYSLKRFSIVFKSNYSKRKKDFPSYYEYRSVKLENNVSGAFIAIPGLVFFVAALIFMLLYHKYY